MVTINKMATAITSDYPGPNITTVADVTVDDVRGAIWICPDPENSVIYVKRFSGLARTLGDGKLLEKRSALIDALNAATYGGGMRLNLNAVTFKPF